MASAFPSRFTVNTSGPTRRINTSRLDLGGALEDLGGAVVRGAVGGLEDRIRRLAAGGGGSEPPSGENAVPGNFAPQEATCPEGTFRILGKCVDLIPGGKMSGAGLVASGGEAVLGQFGVAMVPEQRERVRLRCPRGMVLGLDNLCYNRRDLRKDERKWVPARKPLLTGGELNAISTALSAAKKLDRQKKRLKKTARAFERAS